MSTDYDTATNVRKLDNATLIVALISTSFLENSDLIEELQVAINRQRYGMDCAIFKIRLDLKSDDLARLNFFSIFVGLS